ncbi:MAG: uroporphyrinogen-III C-methyltransferase [Actinobacteria bacterium]|nr:uroporphyrinogen-III C-methyltransferase [Actinomycetota bacterium]
MSARPGTIYLVGAGPGDPGLITVRGLEILKTAAAVVYDRLVAPELLNHVRPDAVREFVGKAPGQAARTQTEISALLVRLAREGRAVCRLKGGDPFVFGRGGEEALAAADAGVPCEVVPGVTSAIAAPASAGIPVTHRGVAAAVTIVTGHEDPAKAEPQVDWAACARLPGTLVIMMGVGTLAATAAALVAGGRDLNEPVAVIERGTMPAQRWVRGTLASIVEAVRREGIGNPAVVVVGPVVGVLSPMPSPLGQPS